MQPYQSLRESFTSEMYKDNLKAVLKHLPKEALKGMWAYGSKSGSHKNWEVQIPPNSTFKKGLYIHVGQAHDSFDAKGEALFMILRRFEDTETYGTIDEVIESGRLG